MRSRLSWVSVVLLLMYAVALAARLTVQTLRADERRRVLQEVAAVEDARLLADRAAWARERDSLISATGKRDTVLRWRIRTVQGMSWLPADTASVVRYTACRAQLDSLADACAAFRTSAAAALVASDSLHAADSVRALELRSRLLWTRDSLARVTRERDRRPTWRAVGLATGVLLLATLAR